MTARSAFDLPCAVHNALAGRFCSPTEEACAARVEAARKATTDADLLALARDVPPLALREMVRVLRHGAVKYGCAPNEPGGEQLAGDHARHATEHIARSFPIRSSCDEATGALDLIHAAARALLAAECVLSEGRK